MKWLADNARFTLLYKHLANRACPQGTQIPELWQQQLQQTLDATNEIPWRQLSGRQKLLRLCCRHEEFGQNGLQPRHWLRALRVISRATPKFGHVIILAFMVICITLIHTDYLLLEVSRQFESEQQAMPEASRWVLHNGLYVAHALFGFVVLLSLWLKLHFRALRTGFEKLNPQSLWHGRYSFSHLNIAMSIFLLSKLSRKSWQVYWNRKEQQRVDREVQRYELTFMAQDPDCAELLLHQHVELAIHAARRLQKQLAYLCYLLMAGWLCVLMFGMSQAFLDWGKLGL